MRLDTLKEGQHPAPTGNDRLLIEAAIEDDAAALKELIAANANVNAHDEYGMTALHHAAGSGSRSCIRALVSSDQCDYLARDDFGRYASDLAIEWGRDYGVGRLLTKHQIRQARERGVPPWLPHGQQQI